MNIILGKIKPYTEKITRDYKNGFRDRRSVNDNGFALKIINEKTREYNHSVHYLFIDFQKARNVNVWKNLKFLKKLINMCRTCIQKTRSAVKIDRMLSSFFENKTVLKKGDSLSQYYSI